MQKKAGAAICVSGNESFRIRKIVKTKKRILHDKKGLIL